METHLSKAKARFLRELPGHGLAKLLPWLFSAVLLAGCARHYDMTLTNGTRITNVTKPVKDKESGAFYYKDVAGTVHHVSAGRVVEITPHSNKNIPAGTLQQ